MMGLTEMRVQVEKGGGGVAADGALLGLAGPEVDRVDVARQGTCGEQQSSISLRASHAEPGRVITQPKSHVLAQYSPKKSCMVHGPKCIAFATTARGADKSASLMAAWVVVSAGVWGAIGQVSHSEYRVHSSSLIEYGHALKLGS